MSDRFTVPTHHGPLPDGLDLTAGRFISIFQDQSGKQSVFSADTKSKEAQLCVVRDHGDWAMECVNYEDMDGPFVLDAHEQKWLLACWASLLGRPIFEVASRYLATRQTRTMLISIGVPADVHAHFFEVDQ